MLEFGCGAAFGLIQLVLGQPLDYFKVKYQSTQPTPKNQLNQFNRQISSQKGLRGYYKGASSLLLGLPIATGVHFALYQILKQKIAKIQKIQPNDYGSKILGIRQIGVAGMGSGLVSSFFYCPIEYAKIQKQVNHNFSNKSSIGILTQSIMKGRFSDTYKGIVNTMKRQTLGSFVYFTFYQLTLRQLCKQKNINRQFANFWDYFIGGAVAGFSYWTVIYPYDHIKTRIQLSMAKQYEKIKTLKSVYRGYPIAVLRGTLINAVGLAFYQYIRSVSQMIALFAKA